MCCFYFTNSAIDLCKLLTYLGYSGNPKELLRTLIVSV